MGVPGQPLDIARLLPVGITENDVFTLLAALAAFGIVWSIGSGVRERDRLGPRLKAMQERRKEMHRVASAPARRKKQTQNTDWMKSVVSRLKVVKESQADRVENLLIQAGIRFQDAIVIYAFAKLIMPFVGLALGVAFSGINWSNPFDASQAVGWLILIGLGYIFARLPDMVVSRLRSKRYYNIRRALSDTLDLMLICAEAGLSLSAAIDRVARELGNAYPEMAEELSYTSIEIGFLPDRGMALRHFAERVDIQEIRSIVNVLLQTEKYGTPVSQALRVLSRDFRTERMLRAEQKAAKLPALMTVPMIVFILPTLMVVILAPALIKVMDL